MSIDNRGFTLIEFLVAVVILTVGLLGLLETVDYAIIHNTVNALRHEALVLADERMNLEKAKPYDQIQTPYQRNYSSSRLVNGAFRMYSVAQDNATLGSLPTKRINIGISWRYKHQNFTHSISSLVSR